MALELTKTNKIVVFEWDGERGLPKCLSKTSQSVTVSRRNWVLLLQIEMFEEVSLQAELGAYVVALEVGGVHS